MSIPSWAVKGAKVVCIRQGYWACDYGLTATSGPKKGDVCTIAAVIDDAAGAAIALVEHNPAATAFRLKHFAPVAPQKTQAEDVAMIKDLIGIKTEEHV